MESLNNEDLLKELSEIIESNCSLENLPLKVAPIVARFLQYATVVATVLVFILKALILLQDVEPPRKTQLTTV